MSQIEELVVSERRDAVVRLTLNNPSSYNALSRSMMSAAQDALDDIADDTSVRAVILQGAGKGFCAGHDLKEVRSINDHDERLALFHQCSKLMLSLQRLPQPVIAQVHGMAAAAGCQMVATCDLAIAADTARFSTPGVNIGLFCSTPMVALSRNVTPKHAMEMLLTGEAIDAQTATQFGLINQAVQADELDAACWEMATKIADKSGHVVKIGKRAFYDQLPLSIDEAYAHTAQVMTDNLAAKDANEGIGAFVEKRAPKWSHE